MCVVSMIGDEFSDRWKRNPEWWRTITVPGTGIPDTHDFPFPDLGETPPFPKVFPVFVPPVSREEYERLLEEVRLLRDLLERAAKYDEKNGEPNCETEDKMRVLRSVAEAMGVKLSI